MLFHEKKIPSQVDFYSFFPSNPNSKHFFLNFKNINFEHIGYIRPDTNSKNNYESREFRKSYMSKNCLYLKIVLQKNYSNKFNVFNQVSIVSLDFFGVAINLENTIKFNEEKRIANEIHEDMVDELSLEKVKQLKIIMSKHAKNDDFDEAKKIKEQITEVFKIGRILFELNYQKKILIQKEEYDEAKIVKFEIEKLKQQLKNFERNLPEISFENKSDSNQINDKESLIHNYQLPPIYNNSNSRIEGSINNSVNNSYDELVIPAIINKDINKEFEVSNENIEQNEEKLEDLDENLKLTYEQIIPIIGEITLKKIFSKNLGFRETGIDELLKNLDKIFLEKSNNKLNIMIESCMKIIIFLFHERQPIISIKTIEIFQKLLEKIGEAGKSKELKLDYNADLTSDILSKIKERLFDPNLKLRKKSIEIYTYMTKQSYCDYNSLIEELIEDISLNTLKNTKIIQGKMLILDMIMNDLKNAVNEKRTSESQFPFYSLLTFCVLNLKNQRNEIKQMSRVILVKIYKEFGFSQFEPFIRKIHEKELIKLKFEIKEIDDYLKKSNDSDPDSGEDNKRGKGKKNKDLQCKHCKSEKIFEKEDDLKLHYKSKCIMFGNCFKCDLLIEIKNYYFHLTSNCIFKDDFKICKKCKEPIHHKIYEKHLKEDKCIQPKYAVSQSRCLLCHKDVESHEKGFLWVKHLTECEMNKQVN